jgi:hypothetical protein
MQLKRELRCEDGPISDRPARVRFDRWAQVVSERMGVPAPLVSLEFFQPEDSRQMLSLAATLASDARAIHYYLDEHIFPKVCVGQIKKLSASGQELGSDILFGTRLGFSGTPSDLLPNALYPCGFELGSEGKVIHTLSHPGVVTVDCLGRWDVRELLLRVANADPPLSALIDSGALVTGMSNLEVSCLSRPWFLVLSLHCTFHFHCPIHLIRVAKTSSLPSLPHGCK